MDLLDSYLSAIKPLLPRGQRNDILAELSEELRSQIEEREEALGRPLTEEEQHALFVAHGDPLDVARRYNPNRRSLALGWELIGPDLFPAYRLVLGLNLSIAVLCTLGYALVLQARVTFRMLAVPIVGQVICVTVTFILLNLARRKAARSWLYAPPSLAPFQPIARWISLTGLIVWSLATLYWLALPQFPALALGGDAGPLALGPIWERVHLPLLVLLLLGLAQRAVNLARPEWSGLAPFTRVFVNFAAIALTWVFFRGYPWVMISDPAVKGGPLVAAAQHANGFILWAILSWIWIYFLINGLVNAGFCLPYLRRWRQRDRAPTPP